MLNTNDLYQVTNEDKVVFENSYSSSNTTSNAYNISNNKEIHQDNPIKKGIIDKELALNYPIKFIAKYINKDVIENAIKLNPNIKKILEEEHLELKYDIENATSISLSHLVPTTKKAQEIYLRIGHSKIEDNYTFLTQAALLHDIGKVFIPKEILNKKGKLTPKERSIIELHNRLSFEILITTSLNPKVAQLTYEHHDYENKVVKNHENQALTIADVYCALKETRPYKKPINEFSARAILYDMGTKGKLDPRYISYIN